MFQPDQYALLDFGSGRKLERLGPMILDRPSPAADAARRAEVEAWRAARASYHRSDAGHGQWKPGNGIPQRWTIRHGPIAFELKPTDFGHVGVFPEQAENWDWLARQVATAGRLKVLNLFAYTGGSTLAVAAAGGQVTHIDAAKNIVGWARRNAGLSGLGEAPIRWIPEDAQKFVAREIRRGSRYDAVILDPPSYGHGPKGELWRMDEHFARLLACCAELTGARPRFVLVTCHSPGVSAAALQAEIAAVYPELEAARWDARRLAIRCGDGRRLDAGMVARWPR